MLNGKAIPNTGLWDQYRSYPNGASLTGFPTLVSTIGQPNTCTLALFANAMTTTYGISVAQPNAVINIIQVY